jgi:hypothetical protein
MSLHLRNVAYTLEKVGGILNKGTLDILVGCQEF